MRQCLTFLFCLLLLYGHSQVLVDPIPVSDNVTFVTNKYLCLNCNGQSAYPSIRYASININALDIFTALKPEYYSITANDTLEDNAGLTKLFNDAIAQNRTVFISSGMLYWIKKKIIINMPANGVLKVYMNGATFKLKDLTQYSMWQFLNPENAYTSTIIWVGGTIDGNKDKQRWPLNPTGGIYDSYDAPLGEGVGDKYWWEEDHGALIDASWFKYALFNGVNIINSVVDGISVRRSYLSVISDSRGTQGADLKYSLVHEQGTYFKCTRSGYKYIYFMNITCIGASIVAFASYEDGIAMDTGTVCFVNKGYFENNAQNALHFEDSYRIYLNAATVVMDTNRTTYPQILFSNRSRIVYVENSSFTNQRLDFSTSAILKVGSIKYCTFKTTLAPASSKKIDFFIGGATHVYGCTFDGQPAQDLVKSFYVSNCKFTNYGTALNAITGAYEVDNTVFPYGSKTINFRNGNSTRSYNNSYSNGHAFTNYTAPGNWLNPWLTTLTIKTKGRVRIIKMRDDL